MDRGIAIVVDDGVQVPQPEEVPHRDRLDPKTASRMQQTERGSTVVRSSALDFLRRMIASVTGFINKIRRFFAFTLAHDEIGKGNEERGVTRNEISVEEGLVEASGACEPQLAEIIVSESKGTSTNAEPNTVEGHPHEDGGGNCSRPIPVSDNEQSGTRDGDNSTLRADNRRAAGEVECGSSPEQATVDPLLQNPADTATGEPDMPSSPVPCSAHDDDLCHSQARARDASRDDFTQNGSATVEVPSPRPCASDSKLETSVDKSALEPFTQTTTSKNTKKKFSIHHLNAMVTEQLTKYLQVLERTAVQGALNQTQHRRAIIVATLVAVAVWARNSRHLHESVPRIRGSCINVHIRSRL